MDQNVAVVVPFYQQEAGVLRRSVASVLGQKGNCNPLVIVVDDGSPMPGRTELAPFLPAYSQQILLIEQKNGGAAAARNAGLDHVPSEISLVAFLDSDDEWTELHLDRAAWALNHGFDFYFSDFYQLNQSVTAFDRAKRIDVKKHPRIHPTEPIREYRGDMFNQILCGNIIGTSTVVYNFRKFPALRYPLGFRHTGEEYIFWLHLARGSQKLAFSSDPECRYGAGVNIFADSAWGTDKYLTIQHDEIKWRKYVLNNFPVSSEQVDVVKGRIRELREHFAGGLIHNLMHNGTVKRQILADQVTMDLLTVPATFATVAKLGFRKIRGRFVGV